MDRRLLMSPESAQASDIFDKFCTANTLKAILNHYRQLCSLLKLKPTHFPDFYPRIRQKLCSWRAQGLWTKFEKRASHKCYARGKACVGNRVLIIGGGPCGLRAAIEAQLLGAKVVLVEKRDRFSRNNVLHLWPFVIADLKALGAKKFYGKFCAGSIDHISIRQLQCILLKVALLLGVEVHEGVGFEGLREPTEDEGWRAVTSPADHPVSHYCFDCLIGADGRRNTLDGFKRKALRAKLAIAITANFINKHTEAEARVKEISGVSYIFNQKFFQDLNEATGIDLENIVYYKDETHYFVMTAKKQSLLNKGVLLNDFADTAKLLSHENISTEALMIYSLEAAVFSTENQLPSVEFAINHYGQPDVAMFDFTAMYAAENACRVIQRKDHRLMMTLVGDSLLEPFWPTGSGCARGFLSSFDACWMLRGLASGSRSVLEVIAERESIYRLLGQTTPENLNKEHMSYTLEPHTRYPNLNQRVVMPFQVKSLFDSDEKTIDNIDSLSGQDLINLERITKKRRRDAIIPVDSLLSWLREQVQCYGLEITNVNDVFARGDVLCAILHRFRPDLIEFPPSSEENMEPSEIVAQRNQMVFDFLQKEYGIIPVFSGEESAQVNSFDFHTLVAYLSQLYDTFKGEIPQIKYPRVDGSEELEELSYRSSHNHTKYTRPSLVVKQGLSVKVGRKLRTSSSTRDGEHSDASRRHRKRRSDERSRISVEERAKLQEDIEKDRLERQRRRMQERILQTERFIKSMRMLQMNEQSRTVSPSDENGAFEDYTFHLYRQMAPDFEDRCKSLERKLFYSGREVKTSTAGSHSESEKHHVTGLAKNLEEKLKGTKPVDKKPKDLIRAIGKIEKSDWNVQLIEKKIAEGKTHGSKKKEQDKVPKWSREAYDDKREAMKRKMEGISERCVNAKELLFDETVKKLGNKLKEGNTLDIGQRGSNKVSQMAEKLSHKLVKPEAEPAVKQSSSRPVFEFPTKGGSESCHFCNQRVYVVERMTTEGKYFHRNCFRCEYCNTSLRLGNYVFDREGRYGERFYCAPHYTTIRLYGWKKYDQLIKPESEKFSSNCRSSYLTPASHQILSEMDDRGTTPERVEFENSVDFASEEELLSEMDEDEWTDRNFGASNADNNTSDEASDLSEDDDVTPDGNTDANEKFPKDGAPVTKNKLEGSSDSDTEIASTCGSSDDASSEGEDLVEDDDGEDEEEECEGSTTEVETDSEFAEDPPHCVPGQIPTIVVNEPEQLMTRLLESELKKSNINPKISTAKTKAQGNVKPHIENIYGELPVVEPVLRNEPKGRALPKVYSAPKKWESLASVDAQQEAMATKYSLDLKQKYLQGAHQPKNISAKKPADPATQQQFTSVLDMISEKQKLLQPASKPSPSMQAFLEGAEKLKNKTTFSSIGGYVEGPDLKLSPNSSAIFSQIGNNLTSSNKSDLETITMNLLNLEKTKQSNAEEMEKSDPEKELLFLEGDPMSSRSQSKTESQCTIVEVNKSQSEVQDGKIPDSETDSGSELESVSGEEAVSDLDEVEGETPVSLEPPRLEIEDEFGVSLSLDEEKIMEGKHSARPLTQSERFASTCGMSSSDSKDSLNSGCFLETEMSDWSKDTGASDHAKLRQHPKLSSLKGKHMSIDKGMPAVCERDKSALALNFESIDFADVDVLSSPDVGVKTSSPCIDQASSSCKPSDKVGNLEEATSINIQVTEKPEQDNLEKNRPHEPSELHCDFDKHKVIIEPIQSRKVQPQSISDKERFALLDRVIPFSKARDSLDYRKMKTTGNPLKSSSPLIENITNDPNKLFQQIETGSIESNLESKHSSEGLSSSSSLEAGDWASRTATSPGTARRIEEISKERSKQSDLIKSMVMGRIRRSPEKYRRGSRGAISPLPASSSGSFECIDKPEKLINDISDKSKRGDDCTATELVNSSCNQTTPINGENQDSFELALQTLSTKRSHPIFESPLSLYQSSTNPSTPSHDFCPLVTEVSNSKYNLSKEKSPSVYRSMPDLFAALSEVGMEKEGKPKVNKVSSFATPNVKKWEEYRTASAVTREKAREAARQRARLKSDEELGLDATDNYEMLKDKLKRKLSFAEDEVFNPDAPITTRVYSHSEPTSTSSPVSNPYSFTISMLDSHNRDPDNAATCFRPNVDFPMKQDPFLVSSNTKDNTCHQNDKICSKDDFLLLNLRLAKAPITERPGVIQIDRTGKFPNYFSESARENCQAERSNKTKGHTRSFTVSEINLDNLNNTASQGNRDLHEKHFPTSYEMSNDPKNGSMTHIQGHSSVNTFSQPSANSSHFDCNTNSSSNRNANKTKALSTEMLVGAKFTLPPGNEPFRGGISVPDVTHDFVSSEKKPKGSKDRNRRRSLIQAVSDFFTPKSSTGNKPSSSVGENDKSPSTSSSSPVTPKETKFSIFKLTPKLLQKDKCSPPASPENQSLLTRSNNKNTEKSKTPRSSFMSYISQPEIVLQRLSNSPNTSKSSRKTAADNSNLPKNTEQTRKSKQQGMTVTEKQRKNEILEIQLQLESIETDQRQLEQKGISLERKLRGEEEDDGQDHDELMEEWFTLVREKIRLSRYEKELIVRAKQLDLTWKEQEIEEELEKTLFVADSEKSSQIKSREVDLFQELNSVKRQKEALLTSFHEDMMKYELEDAELEAKCAVLSPRESNV